MLATDKEGVPKPAQLGQTDRMAIALAPSESPQHYLQRELLQKVQESPEIFHFLRSAALDGLWYWDLMNPEHEWMDDRFWLTLGVDPSTKAHCPAAWHELIHPEDLALAQKQVQRHLKDPAVPYDQVVRYKHANGSTVWIRCRGMALRDAAGVPIRMLGAHVDVTAIAQAKQEAEAASRALKQHLIERQGQLDSALCRLAGAQVAHENQRSAELKQLINALPLLVWTCDAGGHCNYLGDQWIAYTGVPQREQLDSGWLKQVHPEDVDALTHAWSTAVKTGSPFDTEFRIRRHDGQYRWFKTRASPIRDTRGLVDKWVGSNTDIHDLRMLERTLRERSTALERSNAELEQFAYVTSHDLQEPLRTITNYVQLLSRHYKEPLDERAQTYMSFIVSGAQRMRDLVVDLLSYSRATADAEAEMAAQCEAETALATALSSLATLFEESGAQLITAPLPRVRMPETALVSVFQNLLSNAIRYTDGRTPRIKISCTSTQNAAVISIHDNGIGIAKEHHSRIFQMFQRLHSTRDYPGTGVGLALCRRLITGAGGDIWVESTEGEGSSFHIHLPTRQ